RAKMELYLCHARMREFRGQLSYAIPSSFIARELPEEVEQIDASLARNYARSAADEWRAKVGPAARDWADTGTGHSRPSGQATQAAAGSSTAPDPALAVGALVQHDEYGLGQVTDLSGFGALRRVRIRFPS